MSDMNFPIDMEWFGGESFSGLVVRFYDKWDGEIIHPATGGTPWIHNKVGYRDRFSWGPCDVKDCWKPYKPIISNFLDDSLFQIDV